MKKFLLWMLSLTLFSSLQTNAQCTIDAGANTTVCDSWSSFLIQGNGTGYDTYQWTTSGTGTFSDLSNNGLTAYYIPSTADITAGSVDLSVTGTGNCASKTAVSIITFHTAPLLNVDAGADQTGCGALTLTATATNAESFHWVALGSGALANENDLTTKYTPTNADQLNGSVRLWAIIRANDPICGYASDTDEVVINYIPPNEVYGGPNLVSCQTASVSITGSSLTNATGVIWSTSGTGTFSSTTDLHPTYQPSTADILAGNVHLMVQTTGNGSCPEGRDTLQVDIFSIAASVNAGADQTVCKDVVTLTPAYTGTSGVTWSTSGTGTFSAPSTTNATSVYYTLSNEDVANFTGVVTLTATTISNGLCPTATDHLTIRTTSNAGLNVGSDTVVCPGAIIYPVAHLQAGTLIWTTSGTGTFSDPTSLTPVYTPSAADQLLEGYWLTATTPRTNWCLSQSGTKRVFLKDIAATANAGSDQTICGSMAACYGTVTNATGGIWTSSGTGTFNPGSNYLSTSYIFSDADIANSFVTLTLTTTGMCNASATDAMTVTTLGASAPVLHAGPDQLITGTSVTLNGTSFATPGVQWFSSGTGTFSNANALSTIYTPSTLDLQNGIVYLTLSGLNTICYVSDVLSVKFGTTYTLTGTIKAGVNTLDNGLVALYKKEGSELYLAEADSIKPSDAGTYAFDNVVTGKYILLATPTDNSIYQSNFLPTYLGDTQDWQNAQVITVSDNSSYPISLTPYVSTNSFWNTGLDTITGIVYVDHTSLAAARIQTTSGTPAVHAIVYLADANGNKISYTQTDTSGRYKFVNVIAGAYSVIPEYGGTSLAGTTTSIPVTIDGNPATIEDASVTVQKISTSTGVFSATKSAILRAYPNPAKNIVSVDLVTSAGTGLVKLTNENGTVMFQQAMNLSGSSITLNIEALPAGMYILQLIAEDEVYTSKVVKY
ncbi:T9SS type A sorting domain-containing protein [Cytophaga hutchinsonii]|uniref:CHU large protein uncharacterized n=1 Tax=Cytophaga hutchinsonii (strain ATCC 33406 / DSM 1761 / CIP 103989 / NBRC 15051 / NCIMB 9469 / D465) TaxID=269798 RepID=A0A6N4SP45_CYTH3|nr:T9SS type A sorting domain-containing protein [Cytophaga hutchinsonii]ABG58091.1 CHU large protein; uncharacterized [Cytophaga hutchinsonii ATCC 33406]SFX13338.1 Por secretion system C-terminal sorting domain-containing protein [Cytophaga hutchinsonii ATCC 33406]